MVKLVHAPEMAMWFDLGTIQKHVPSCRLTWDEVSRLPYPRICCVLITPEDGAMFATLVESSSSMVNVSCVSKEQNGKVLYSGNLYIKADPDGKMLMQVSGDRPKDEHRIASLVRPLSVVLHRIHAERQTYRPAPAGTPAQQAKRKRHGKAQLFDWNTVTIAPRPDKCEYQGGTHASPRMHDRRGHWRKYQGGKVGWVKNCKVGSATQGMVFKDYRIPITMTEHTT